jgi:hypothetical protein
MTIALPAMVYPLWAEASEGARLPGFVAAPAYSGLSGPGALLRTRWLRWAGLGLLILALLGGVVATYRASAAARASARADQTLIADLERLGVRHMYTDYWTCDKVAFLSQERITCESLKAGLERHGFNRYPPYVAAVEADPQAAYVFPASSSQALALAQQARDPAWPYTLTRMDGYVVYLRRAQH